MNDLSSRDIDWTRKLNEIILENLEKENFGVKGLAHAIGMSRFNLNRKLHFLYRKTINQYIREVRLHKAMEMLIHEAFTASEVSFKVGFSSPAYFSTCFSEHYGYPPGEAKKRSLSNDRDHMEGSSEEPALFEQGSDKSGIVPGNWKKTSGWAFSIVFILILLIIAAVYLFNFISFKRLHNQTKSIAVLPFINDSQDTENLYFINGVMEAILDNLSKIQDLEVHPRTSVEPYRNVKTKSVPQIARELGVNYIIEGSGQKIGDQVSLYIQLIEASSDKHLFSQRYNMKLEDIFDLQSEIALKVASEIKAAITFEEKELIKKTHTTNFAALNLYLQANDLHNIAESEGKWELDVKAERLYKRAILFDSTYADPYASLGWVVVKRNIDSALYLANMALHFDSKNPEAYILKGDVFYHKGLENEAEEAYRQSIKYKPNNSAAFRHLGELYFYQGNCYNAIKNQLQAFHLENNSIQEQNNLESFCWNLYSLGFYAEGKKFAEKQLELDNDSSYYYCGLATVDLDLGNYQAALKSSLKMYACDTDDLDNISWLFANYIYLRDFREAKVLMEKYTGIIKRQGGKIEPDYLFGFCCLENGQGKEAAFHLEGTIREMSKLIEVNQPSVTCRAYLTLAKIYSVRGEKAKALECLQKVTDCMGLTIIAIKDYKNCTMFDNIRNEPGFVEYLSKAQVKYMKEHERVKRLLLDEDILITSL